MNQNTWHLHTPRDASFDEAYQTPLHNRFRSVYPLPDSPQAANFLNSELIADGRDGKSNTPRLKGAVWPGMNIFDAATPDMQRMRNQKKHASVLQNMVLTSQSIEQDELIWDDKMVEITRTRNVYDSPSLDGSPVSTTTFTRLDSVILLWGVSLIYQPYRSQRKKRKNPQPRSAVAVVLLSLSPAPSARLVPQPEPRRPVVSAQLARKSPRSRWRATPRRLPSRTFLVVDADLTSLTIMRTMLHWVEMSSEDTTVQLHKVSVRHGPSRQAIHV